MTVPTWARWVLAAVLVVGVATAGVAANLKVLGGESDDTRLGTLSARSLDPTATPIPVPQRVDDSGDERDDDRDDHRDDDEDDD